MATRISHHNEPEDRVAAGEAAAAPAVLPDDEAVTVVEVVDDEVEEVPTALVDEIVDRPVARPVAVALEAPVGEGAGPSVEAVGRVVVGAAVGAGPEARVPAKATTCWEAGTSR